MKLQALMIAMALAAGTAFAQAPNDTAKAQANMSASGSMATSGETKANEQAPVKKMHKMHRKVAKKHYARRHHQVASAARHHRHHMVASARHHHHLMARARMEERTRTMGAGPSPSVDLNSPARERRMDAAYNDWLRLQGRR